MDHPEMNQLNMMLAIAVVLLVAGGIWVFVTDPKQIIREAVSAPSPTIKARSTPPQKVMSEARQERLKAMSQGLH